jgi:hypothetical protein
MQIKPILITLWKKQGLTEEEIIARARSLNLELPEDYELINRELRNPRLAGSIKNSPTVTFRPTPEIDKYLQNIRKGKKSNFINKAILFYIQNEKSKWN